jgi:ParB/RepB/Spo0J family partition protein
MEYQVEHVPMRQIFADPTFNCRGDILPSDVRDLAADIKLRGLDQPIALQNYTHPQKPEIKYRVIAGHRRHMAHVINKAPTIAAFIRTDIKDELSAREMNFRENLHRAQLNIVQEATALKYFLSFRTDKGTNAFTDKDLAQMLGQSTGWVMTRKQLLTLPEDIQSQAAAGILSQTHIKKLVQLDRLDQYDLIRQIKEQKAKGEKVTIQVHNNDDLLKAKQRTRGEIKQLNNLLYDLLGPGIITRFGAWAAGEISAVSFMMELEKHCKEVGIAYRVPEEIRNAIIGTVTKKKAELSRAS